MDGRPWRDSHRLEDRGVDIRRTASIRRGKSTMVVAAPVNLTALNSSPGQNDRVDIRIVVASGTPINPWRSSKISEDRNERIVECSTIG